jgi:hypothetical protein
MGTLSCFEVGTINKLTSPKHGHCEEFTLSAIAIKFVRLTIPMEQLLLWNDLVIG